MFPENGEIISSTEGKCRLRTPLIAMDSIKKEVE